MKHIPNFITSLNLASGFFAVIFLLKGDLITASWLIFAAMVFDFLDGFASRILKAYSDMGKELDGLADVVSFGVAPGSIIYHLLYDSLPPGTSVSGLMSVLFLIVAATMPVCAGLRLAKFNIDTSQATSFKGLPTPANALAVISLIIGAYYSDSEILDSFVNSPVALIIFTLFLSAMMVIRIPLLSLKFKNLNIKGNEGRFILIIMCALMISIFGIGTVPLIIPFYIIISLLSLLI